MHLGVAWRGDPKARERPGAGQKRRVLGEYQCGRTPGHLSGIERPPTFWAPSTSSRDGRRGTPNGTPVALRRYGTADGLVVSPCAVADSDRMPRGVGHGQLRRRHARIRLRRRRRGAPLPADARPTDPRWTPACAKAPRPESKHASGSGGEIAESAGARNGPAATRGTCVVSRTVRPREGVPSPARARAMGRHAGAVPGFLLLRHGPFRLPPGTGAPAGSQVERAAQSDGTPRGADLGTAWARRRSAPMARTWRRASAR